MHNLIAAALGLAAGPFIIFLIVLVVGAVIYECLTLNQPDKKNRN